MLHTHAPQSELHCTAPHRTPPRSAPHQHLTPGDIQRHGGIVRASLTVTVTGHRHGLRHWQRGHDTIRTSETTDADDDDNLVKSIVIVTSSRSRSHSTRPNSAPRVTPRHVAYIAPLSRSNRDNNRPIEPIGFIVSGLNSSRSNLRVYTPALLPGLTRRHVESASRIQQSYWP